MSLRDVFRRRRKPEQEPAEKIGLGSTFDDDGFTLLGRGKGQATGPIMDGYGRGVRTSHENRAGRRAYVKLLQPSRQVRKNIVGFGRWRRWPPRWHGESWAAQTAVGDRLPRAARRANMIAIYRGRKRARGRRVTLPGR